MPGRCRAFSESGRRDSNPRHPAWETAICRPFASPTGSLARLTSPEFPTELRSSGQSSAQGFPVADCIATPGDNPPGVVPHRRPPRRAGRLRDAAAIRAPETVGYADSRHELAALAEVDATVQPHPASRTIPSTRPSRAHATRSATGMPPTAGLHHARSHRSARPGAAWMPRRSERVRRARYTTSGGMTADGLASSGAPRARRSSDGLVRRTRHTSGNWASRCVCTGARFTGRPRSAAARPAWLLLSGSGRVRRQLDVASVTASDRWGQSVVRPDAADFRDAACNAHGRG